ncbi:MAG: MFS transporter [Alphaproteobacteria bacterium]
MLWLVLGAMLIQQTFTTWGKIIVSVIGPAMTADLGLAPELVGVFVAISGIAGTIAAAGCGAWIQRLGAMRMSQAALLITAAGLCLALPGWMPAIALAAVVVGMGTVISTPASSEILIRYAPPKHAPLVFSIKQAGVPAGTMLAGLVGPLCVALYGWRAGLIVTAASMLVLAIVMMPLVRRLNRDGGAAGTTRPSMLTTMRGIVRDRAMRGLAMAQTAYVGLQSTFFTFFVTFLVVQLDYDIVAAGQLFAASQVVAVVSRIFWGWLGGVLGGPRRLLGLLGVSMAAVSAMLGFATTDRPVWLLTAVALGLAGTAVSWQGVTLSEVARNSGPGMVGANTGGIIAFGSAAGIVYPLTMTAVIALTGDYAICFWVAAVPPLLAALPLFRRI